MKIKIKNATQHKKDGKIIQLLIRQYDPLCFTLDDRIRMSNETEELIRRTRPEKWVVMLNHNFPNLEHGPISFTEMFDSKKELETAMFEGIRVANPDNESIKEILQILEEIGDIEILE